MHFQFQGIDFKAHLTEHMKKYLNEFLVFYLLIFQSDVAFHLIFYIPHVVFLFWIHCSIWNYTLIPQLFCIKIIHKVIIHHFRYLASFPTEADIFCIGSFKSGIPDKFLFLFCSFLILAIFHPKFDSYISGKASIYRLCKLAFLWEFLLDILCTTIANNFHKVLANSIGNSNNLTQEQVLVIFFRKQQQAKVKAMAQSELSFKAFWHITMVPIENEICMGYLPRLMIFFWKWTYDSFGKESGKSFYETCCEYFIRQIISFMIIK